MSRQDPDETEDGQGIQMMSFDELDEEEQQAVKERMQMQGNDEIPAELMPDRGPTGITGTVFSLIMSVVLALMLVGPLLIYIFVGFEYAVVSGFSILNLWLYFNL